MTPEDANRLLDRIGVLKHACDLDLLVFFARHPRALLTSEQLAAWLGYELKQIADSLEVLLEAGVLARTQNPTHAARLYVFSIGGSTGGWLPEVLNLASTRTGRLSMLGELSRRMSKATNDPVARSTQHTAHAGRDSLAPRRRAAAVGNQDRMRSGRHRATNG